MAEHTEVDHVEVGEECEWAGHDDRVSATGSCPVCGGSYLL